MPYKDLREYLARLESAGKLQRIRAAVDKDWEIAAVSRLVFERIPEAQRPALIFENVRGHDIPVTLGVLGASVDIYALALDTSRDQIQDLWDRAQKNPIPPRRVETGPVHEQVYLGADADLNRLPTPVWTRGQDPGPYLTAPCVITRDPESGVQNMGTYRCQIKGPRKIGLWINFQQHGRKHVETNNQAGRATPVAIVMGTEPATGLCSVSRVVYGVDELAVAGALRGEPVDVVPCKTVDLLVPATAEIVIEGIIRPNELEEEGPFGEYPGYMGPKAMSYVVDVTAITHRNNPIFQAFLSQMPPSESSCIRGFGREAAILRQMRNLRLPVKDVHLLHPGSAAALLAISMKKEYDGQVAQVMHAAWSVDPGLGKWTVVVDEDIDVRDPFAVLWALAWRVQPHKDIVIFPGTAAVRLDPSQAPEDVPQLDDSRRTSAKIGVDATKKHRFPANALPPAEDLAQAAARWREYGFSS